MDKSEFIELAPQYYALAIICYFLENRLSAVSRRQLIYDESGNRTFLDRDKLYEIAIEWLYRKGMIVSVSDPLVRHLPGRRKNSTISSTSCAKTVISHCLST
jgi:hypothetical protein